MEKKEGNRLNIIAEIAYALAVLSETHSTIMRIYNRNKAKFFAAAQSSPDRNALSIYCGRAEHQIMALRAFGILCIGEDFEINAILRSADRKAYDAIISNSKRGIPIVTEEYVARYSNPDVMYAHVIICLGIYASKNISFERTAVVRDVGEYLINRRKNAAVYRKKSRNEDAISKFREHIGIDGCNGGTELYDKTGDKIREVLDPLCALLNYEDIDFGIYTTDTLISPLDAAYIVGNTREETAVRSLLLLLARAMKRDRDFCLEMYREDKVVELDRMKAERDRAVRESEERTHRIEMLEASLREAEKERDKAKKEADSHAGDASELAALRNALYAASRNADVPADPECRREIPEGIVVIGGHPAWARMISEATSVRVWPAGTTCPNRIIASATEVWIQAAYMSHSAFYAAINAARKAGIAVRYFSGTGVDRCIEDLRGVQQ